jgi:acetylornithine deacetylase/succinyl-diaminopimelate desuccinylase-like protein
MRAISREEDMVVERASAAPMTDHVLRRAFPIAACGIPVVDIMDARAGTIHSAEEFLIVESLAERARPSALTMIRIAQGGMA